MRDLNKRLAIIIPCYNESDILQSTLDTLKTLTKSFISEYKLHRKSFILIVDDGSIDDTWEIIKNHTKNEDIFKGIRLSTNFGHQHALIAGMKRVNEICDIAITIDADLQQDPNAMGRMIQLYFDGNEIVYGVRNDRTGDSVFKKYFSKLYVKLINMFGGNLIKGHADYRLLGKKSLDALLSYNENNIFLRGIVPQLGFKSTIVKFEQKDRINGNTKYSARKMFRLAINGLAGLTIAPLRILMIMGLFSLLMSLFYVVYVIYIKYFTTNAVSGWASIVLPIWIFGSIQLFSIGIIGEYLSRIFTEIKGRPRYIIEEEID